MFRAPAMMIGRGNARREVSLLLRAGHAYGQEQQSEREKDSHGVTLYVVLRLSPRLAAWAARALATGNRPALDNFGTPKSRSCLAPGRAALLR